MSELLCDTGATLSWLGIRAWKLYKTHATAYDRPEITLSD
jgi:hypothetical protein